MHSLFSIRHKHVTGPRGHVHQDTSLCTDLCVVWRLAASLLHDAVVNVSKGFPASLCACVAGGITPKFLDRITKTGDVLNNFLYKESRFHRLLKVCTVDPIKGEQTDAFSVGAWQSMIYTVAINILSSVKRLHKAACCFVPVTLLDTVLLYADNPSLCCDS